MKVIKFIFGNKDSVRRKVIYTMAEVLGAFLVAYNTIWEVDWRGAIGTTLMAGLLCFLIHIKDIKE